MSISILNIIRSQTFWTAAGAFGTIFTLYLIYKQIAAAKNVSAYEFLRREDDRFCSSKMCQYRHDLAEILLITPNDYEKINEHADDVLSYFEDLGLLSRKKIAPIYFVWAMNSYYIIRYWAALEKHIKWIRKKYEDDTYYEDFERLYCCILKFEKRKNGKKILKLSPDEIKEFLNEELSCNEMCGI